MAFDFTDPNFDFAGKADVVARALRRGQAQADQKIGPIAGEMVGSGSTQFYVPPGFGAYGNAVLEKTLGRRDMRQAEEDQGALNTEQLQRFENLSKLITEPGTKAGKVVKIKGEGPTQDGGVAPDIMEDGRVPLDYSNPDDLTADNNRRMGLAQQMMKLNLPQAQKVAQDYLTKGVSFPETVAQLKMKQIETAQQNALRRDEAARLAKEKIEADARLAKEKMDNQRFLAQLAADSRMSIAQLAASMKANGGPSVAQQKYLDKKEGEEKAKTDAQSRSGSLLDEMDINVDILDKNKGITNPDRNAASNLASWAQNTGVGQTAGKMFGTTNQNARNNIESLATNLVLELKNTKGLSASQMNSNMELQRYLTAVAGGNNYDAKSLKDVVRRARTLLGASPASAPADAGGQTDDDLVNKYLKPGK